MARTGYSREKKGAFLYCEESVWRSLIKATTPESALKAMVWLKCSDYYNWSVSKDADPIFFNCINDVNLKIDNDAIIWYINNTNNVNPDVNKDDIIMYLNNTNNIQTHAEQNQKLYP